MKFRFLFVLFFVFVGLIGCNDPVVDDDNNDNEQKEPTLFLTSDNFILNAGDKKEIEYFVDNLDNYVLKYTVTDDSIISVENGSVTALKPGNATVRVTLVGYEDIFGEVKVTVIGTVEPPKPHDSIIDWVKLQIGTELVEARIFPKNYSAYPGATISYESSDVTLVDNMGLLYAREYDEFATITISVDYEGEVVTDEHDVIVIGSVPGNIAKEFLNQFPEFVTNDLVINDLKGKYPNATITFTTSNEEVLGTDGKLNKPENDVQVVITATLVLASEGYIRDFTKTVTVRGLVIHEKAAIVRDTIINDLNLTNYRITEDIELPFEETRFNGTLSWSSTDLDILSSTGKVTLPLVNTMVVLIGELSVNGTSSQFRIELEIMGKENDNTWENVEEFLNFYIFQDEIETMKYRVMGVAPEYIAYNNGYVLFYQNQDLEVIESLLPVDHAFRPGRRMDVKWVTIHDTAGNGPGADAAMHDKFIHNEDRAASSWHYTIDDHELYQHIPLNEVAWHAGEAVGNNTSIGIETCTHVGVDYDLVMRRTAKLVAKLLDDHGLTLYNVRQHNHWSGKNCPQVIRAANRWGEIIDLIGLELYGRQHLSDVTFEWKSLSPDILDDTGKVINHPGGETEVSYQVTATYNGVSKVFTNTAVLQAKK